MIKDLSINNVINNYIVFLKKKLLSYQYEIIRKIHIQKMDEYLNKNFELYEELMDFEDELEKIEKSDIPKNIFLRKIAKIKIQIKNFEQEFSQYLTTDRNLIPNDELENKIKII